MRRLPSVLPATALLLLAVALAACGNGEHDEDLRIHVDTIPIDGPAPAGLKATLLSATGEPDTTYDLVPVEGGRRGEYAIRGGPEGAYQIVSPAGWGDITGTPTPPEVRRGRTPPLVRIGRAASLYVAPATPTLRPGSIWAAERLEAGGRRVRVRVEVEIVPPGFFVVLRFPADDWHGQIEVVGRMVTGIPGAPGEDYESGPLAEPLRITVPEGGGPVVGRPRLAQVAPLEVIPVAAGEDVDVDGLVVHVEVLGLPIPIVAEAPVRRGVATFRAIPSLGQPLVVRMGTEDHAFTIPYDAWAAASRVRVLWSGALPTRSVRVAVPAATEVTDVQARPAAAVAFGRVAFAREAETIVVPVPEGEFALLLRAGSRWARVEGDGDGEVTTPAPTFEKEVRVTGIVRGASPPCFVRFFRHVGGEEAVLADGLEVTVTSGQSYEAHLPPGTYQVEVAGAGGIAPREIPLDATTPGINVELPLRAPTR